MKIILVQLFLLYNIFCYSNFTGIEICARYKYYPSDIGNYGERGVASPTNFPGKRLYPLGTFSKSTNTFWIFGGWGTDGIGMN